MWRLAIITRIQRLRQRLRECADLPNNLICRPSCCLFETAHQGAPHDDPIDKLSQPADVLGLADPEAHAEHVQAASRLGSAAMWPAGIEFRLHPDGACAWKVVMAGCVVNASLGAGEASR